MDEKEIRAFTQLVKAVTVLVLKVFAAGALLTWGISQTDGGQFLRNAIKGLLPVMP